MAAVQKGLDILIVVKSTTFKALSAHNRHFILTFIHKRDIIEYRYGDLGLFYAQKMVIADDTGGLFAKWRNQWLFLKAL